MTGPFPQRVDAFSALPKYYQLKDILLRKIEDGDWQPEESIPSERELEEIYGVSRTTIRKALDILVSKGYLYREHGRGTFVAFPRLQQSLHTLTSFTEDMRRRGMEPGQRILMVDCIQPSRRIRQALSLRSDIELVLRVERLRLGNDEPVGIHDVYLPLCDKDPITADELARSGSLYALLQAKYNLTVADADESLESTVADEREAELLHISQGSPLLLIERISRLESGRPIEFVRMLYRADRYKYYVHLSRDTP